jgi:catechol 2,3-dioxygenase-like lactoylglutathione lyase family enzyme
MTGFVHHLDHVQLAIPAGGEDLARSFFVGLVGFREVEKPAPLKVRGGCWLQSGTVTVHLGVDPQFVPANKAHPAFVVERFGELEKALLGSGFAFTRDTELEGIERAFTHDPFGNRIEFIAL